MSHPPDDGAEGVDRGPVSDDSVLNRGCHWRGARLGRVENRETELDGLDEPGRARGLELARVLADDWLREAGDNELSQQVIELLRTELLAAASPPAPDARRDLLEAEVIDLELRPLSFEGYELGKAVVDGAVIDADATARGREILARVEALGPRVRALWDAERRRALQRRLEEVMLEGLYAVERKAMSHRLGLYLKDKQGDVGPPDLRLRR